MSLLLKRAGILISGIVFTAGILFGQENPQLEPKQVTGNRQISPEQLALLKANRAKQIEFRNAFRETLSGNQLDILTDPRLTREAKLKSFKSSLSANQVNLIKSNSKQIRTQKFEIRSTLTNQQRMQIKRMAMVRSNQNRALYQRARMNKRLRWRL